MKKKKFIYILSMLMLTGMLMLMAGCGKRTEKSDETDSGGETKEQQSTEAETSVFVKEKEEYALLFKNAKDTNDYNEKWGGNSTGGGGLTCGISIKNKPEDGILRYNGNAIELEMEGDASWSTTMGCLVYINGIPQKYYTDTDKTEAYVHSFPVEKDKDGSMKIYFTPGIGKNNDTLDVLIKGLIGASYRPLGPHDYLYPEGNTSPMTTGEFKLQMQADGSGNTDISVTDASNIAYTKYELSKLISTRPDGSIENRLETTGFHNDFDRNIIENNKLHLFAEFGGGMEGGEYIITAYLNGRVLKVFRANLPKDYNSRAVIDDYFIFSDEKLEEYDIQDYNIIYYVAVPVGKGTANSECRQGGKGIVASGREVLQ